MKIYYVYILTNKSKTTLYVGVTNSLVRRVTQHRRGEIEGFTSRYNLNSLVYYESFDDVEVAIAREKQLKGWRRAKKEGMISKKNPNWDDLGERVLGLGPAADRGWHPQERFRRDASALRRSSGTSSGSA